MLPFGAGDGLPRAHRRGRVPAPRPHHRRPARWRDRAPGVELLRGHRLRAGRRVRRGRGLASPPALRDLHPERGHRRHGSRRAERRFAELRPLAVSRPLSLRGVRGLPPRHAGRGDGGRGPQAGVLPARQRADPGRALRRDHPALLVLRPGHLTRLGRRVLRGARLSVDRRHGRRARRLRAPHQHQRRAGPRRDLVRQQRRRRSGHDHRSRAAAGPRSPRVRRRSTGRATAGGA